MIKTACKRVIESDCRTECVRRTLFATQMWKDQRLVWSPEEYGGLSKLLVPKRFVWTPDMMQYNA